MPARSGSVVGAGLLRPKLREGGILRTADAHHQILRHPELGPRLRVDDDDKDVVAAMDGHHTTQQLQEILRKRRGAFAHQDLCVLLFRLWDQDLLEDGDAVRSALFPEHETRSVDQTRPLRLLRSLILGSWMSHRLGPRLSALAPLGRAMTTTPALFVLLGSLVVTAAAFFLGFIPVPQDVFHSHGSWTAGIVTAYVASAIALSLRGVVRAAVQASHPPGVWAAGLKLQFGVVHFDVDAAETSYLQPELRTRFALAGLGGLGLFVLAAAGCTLAGAPLAEAAVIGLLIAFYDLCPFLPTDGARLVGLILPDQQHRVVGYIGRRMVRDLLGADVDNDDSSRFAVVATLWILWFFAATEIFMVFIMDDAIALQAAIFMSEDLALTVVGGAFIAYVAVLLVATFASVVVVLASLLFQGVTPDRASRPSKTQNSLDLDESEREHVTAMLDELPLAIGIPDEAKRALSERLTVVEFEAGTWVQRAGRSDETLFLITEGGVDLLHPRGNGRHDLAARLEAGAYFGEEGLLRRPPHHDVRARTRCRLIRLGADVFTEVVASSVPTEGGPTSCLTIAEFLDGVPELAGLGASGRLELAARVSEREYGADEAIVREGDDASNMYIIERGQCRVTRDGVQLAELDAGATFGEIGLLRGEPRTATVAASSEVRVIEISREAFEHALGRSFHVGLALERLASTRAGENLGAEELGRR